MNEIDKNAKIIWDYMLMKHELSKADAIIALGSNDIRVADRTYEVYRDGDAPKIICTGGLAHTDDINNTGWNMSEAEMYKKRLLELGVNETDILVEKEAKNTGENARFTKALLESLGLNYTRFIVVGKPWNERRGFATFRKQWPEADIVMSSPQMSYDSYMNEGDVDKEVFINLLVGDFQRIKEYPNKGFQIEQEIPDEVWHAYEKLVVMGYDKYLIRD